MAALDALRSAFAAVVDGERTDLARAALALARIGDPDLDPAPTLASLDALAAGIRPRLDPTAPVAERTVKLAAYLFDECGFHGNRQEYYDPRNSFLNEVLARRTGIPITLAVVLLEVGARCGIALAGVGFPGNFLVRIPGAPSTGLLDPFFGGRLLEHDELMERLRAFYAAGGGPAGGNVQRALPQALQTVGPLSILHRMLANLLAIYREREDHEHALSTVELQLVLAPDGAEHLRIRGLLYEQLECFSSAVADFRRCLELAPAAPTADQVREHLAHLERVVTPLH